MTLILYERELDSAQLIMMKEKIIYEIEMIIKGIILYQEQKTMIQYQRLLVT